MSVSQHNLTKARRSAHDAYTVYLDAVGAECSALLACIEAAASPIEMTPYEEDTVSAGNQTHLSLLAYFDAATRLYNLEAIIIEEGGTL